MYSNMLWAVFADKAHFYFNKNAMFQINRAGSVPYAWRPAAEVELVRFQQVGIISPVDVAEFTTSFVVVLRQNGAVRLWGDF